ncbi:MAG: hypothetical protein Q8N84_00910 [bacterium]|nr:hypothetical protein [bacterium]
MKVHRFLLAVFSIVPLSLGVGSVSAQGSSSGTGLSLSPPTFEISANPGDTLKNVIRVQNISEKDVKVAVEKRNFTAIGEEGSVSLTEGETSFSLASWITPGWTEFDLPAKGTTNFPFEIKVPLNAEPGGHFGSIIFKIGSTPPAGASGASLAQELGALILLQISGSVKEEAILETFKVSQNFFEYGPVDFEARVRNEGNIHVKPHGSLIITNLLGRQVASVPVEGRNVLPGAVRKLPIVWETKNLIGRYTATLSLGYGQQGKALTLTTTFWGFPYRVGGVVAVALLLLGVLLYRGRRRVKLAWRVLLGKEIK